MKLQFTLILFFAICFLGCTSDQKGQEQHSEKKILDLGENDKISTVKKGYPFKNKKAEKLNTIALRKIQNKELKEALSYLYQASNLETDNPVILSNIGLAYQKQKQLEKAKWFVEQAIVESDSTYLPALINLANINIDLQNNEASIEWSNLALKKVKEKEMRSGIYLNLMLASSNLNHCSEVKKYFSKFKTIVQETRPLQLIESAEKIMKKCK